MFYIVQTNLGQFHNRLCFLQNPKIGRNTEHVSSQIKAGYLSGHEASKHKNGETWNINFKIGIQDILQF